jgi:hypothetical protein
MTAQTHSQSVAPSITRTLRAAVKIGDDYFTLEETITLPTTASDDDIAQAVATGLRMYEAQLVAVEAQIRTLRTTPGAPPAVTIREPDAPASEKQRLYMDYLLKELSWDNEKLITFAAERQFNLRTLTKREASDLIDQLKGVLAGEAETGSAAIESSAEEETETTGTAEPVAKPSVPVQESPAHPIGEGATQRQRRALERLVDERGIDLEGELRARFGDRVLADLSMDEAGQLLSEWQQLPRQIRPRQAAPSKHAGDMPY